MVFLGWKKRKCFVVFGIFVSRMLCIGDVNGSNNNVNEKDTGIPQINVIKEFFVVMLCVSTALTTTATTTTYSPATAITCRLLPAKHGAPVVWTFVSVGDRA